VPVCYFEREARLDFMKIPGLLLLLAGWLLVLSALVLLRAAWPQALFMLAGVGVEILGLVLLFRFHAIPHGRRQ
jgi:hypothetical protein